MGQKQSKTGTEFEKKCCKEKGWKRESTSPSLTWTGEGRSNWNKIKSIKRNPALFKPLLESSVFDKYDAITQKGERIEIKKVTKKKLKSWNRYSEPIFSVKNWEDIPAILDTFGCESDVSYMSRKNARKYKGIIPQLVKECAVDNYNEFLSGIVDNVGDEIINRITSTSEGVYTEDGFIPMKDLEFRWVTKKQWLGFNRLFIEFRIRQTNTIPLTLKKEVFKLIESEINRDSFIEELILTHFNNKEGK